MPTLSYSTIYNRLYLILLEKGVNSTSAKIIAKTITESTQDGYHSHGINRFQLLLKMMDAGVVLVHQNPKLIYQNHGFERWDGARGVGIINAHHCMRRAIELANKNGMATVALQNTNHWYRGGTYGWMAAARDCIAICMTNTKANMPPWGSVEVRTGNNPLVIAIPRKDGAVVLDMAMSQFSYGKLETLQQKSEKLPIPGGFDNKNKLTNDPNKILATERILPMGYWKGSGLSLMIDVFCTIFADGWSTKRISEEVYETGLSQLFLVWNKDQLGNSDLENQIEEIIKNYTGKGETYYPGMGTLERRNQATNQGITVDDRIWDEILSL